MYSNDYKQLAIKLYYKFSSLRKVANLLDIHYSTISKWLSYIQKPRKIITKKLTYISIVENYIKENPFCSLSDIQILLINNKIEVCTETIRLFLKENNYTKKKAKYYSESKNQEEKTKEFLILREKYIKENRNFVSIDETSFGRNYAPTYGYSLKGTKLNIKRLYTRITSQSVLSASSTKQLTYIKSSKPFNSLSFSNFIKELEEPKGSVIILDNVSFHHSKIVKEVAKEKDYDLLYIPPYSPIFNPIEGIFSIVKRAYYKCKSIEDSFNNLTEPHLKAFFKHSLNAKCKI